MAAKAEENSAAVKDAAELKKEAKTEATEADAKNEDAKKEANGDSEEKAAENGEKKPEGPKPFKYRNSFNATAEEQENSPFLWIKTKSLMSAVNADLEKTQAALNELFVERFKVSVPKVKLPVTQYLFVEMQNKEEKRKVLEECDQPERWNKKFNDNKKNDNKKVDKDAGKVIAQSIAVREEKWTTAEKGTLEEALDAFLPRRNTLYKDQLVEKSKELDEMLDEVVKRSNDAFAKNNRYAKKSTCEKPPLEDIIPMVPNVGYERNVTIDLEKDDKGKVIAGIRVLYEKDEKHKQFLLPLSECSNVAPQIIKAAEATAAFLTQQKFGIYNGVKNTKDIYALKFTMNEIGEIIMSMIVTIDDKFVDEFYDVMDKENIPQGVKDYFAKVAARPKNAEKKVEAKKEEKKDEEEEGDETEPAEDDPEAALEESDVVVGDADKANGDKDDGVEILREGFLKPVSLMKSPLRRVSDQIKEHLDSYVPALKKFFEEKCTPLGVVGIYLTWYAANKRPTEWNRKSKHWYHVAGAQSVTETVNSVKLELYPHLEGYHPTRLQTIPTVMNTIVEGLGLDSNSQVIVACDYHFVQNFIAQKCKKTAALSFMQDQQRSDLKEKHKDKIQFLSARNKAINIFEKAKRHFTGDIPHAVIHWGQFNDTPVKNLYQHRPKKVAWVIDAREDNVNFGPNKPLNADLLKRNNMTLYPHFTLKKVVGLDVGPQKNGQITLIAFYEATTGPIQFNRGQKRRGTFQQGPNAKRNAPNMRGPGGPGGPGGLNQQRRPGGPGGPGPMRGGRGGGPGGPGGFRGRRGGGPAPLMRGGPRGPPPRGPMGPGGRPPHPWGDNRREGYDRPYDRPAPAPDQTVQAASAVLSQLNTIIENQLLLAQMGGPRNRGAASGGGAGGGGGYDRPPQPRDDFVPPPRAPEPGFLARDRSPPGGFGIGRDDFRTAPREDFTRDDAFGPQSGAGGGFGARDSFGSTGRDSFGASPRKDYGFSNFGGGNRNTGGGFGGGNRNTGGGFGGGNRNPGGNRNSGGGFGGNRNAGGGGFGVGGRGRGGGGGGGGGFSRRN